MFLPAQNNPLTSIIISLRFLSYVPTVELPRLPLTHLIKRLYSLLSHISYLCPSYDTQSHEVRLTPSDYDNPSEVASSPTSVVYHSLVPCILWSFPNQRIDPLRSQISDGNHFLKNEIHLKIWNLILPTHYTIKLNSTSRF